MASEFQVKTNCSEIVKLPTTEYYRYNVGMYALTVSRHPNASPLRILSEAQDLLQATRGHTTFTNSVATATFRPKALYDGDAIIYSSHRLKLPDSKGGSILVSLSDVQGSAPLVEGGKGVIMVSPTIWPEDIKVLINTQATSKTATTATNLLQLIIKQATNQNYPHSARAFFSSAGIKPIGGGLELWRGRFRVRDRTGNLKAGFVTTSGVISPLFKDFYLQSHAAIKGNIDSILLDCSLTHSLRIQDLSFALCHTYAKALRSISIPTPVYYAHEVCTCGAFHFNENLRYGGDDASSTVSGTQHFDLATCVDSYKHVNSRIRDKIQLVNLVELRERWETIFKAPVGLVAQCRCPHSALHYHHIPSHVVCNALKALELFLQCETGGRIEPSVSAHSTSLEETLVEESPQPLGRSFVNRSFDELAMIVSTLGRNIVTDFSIPRIRGFKDRQSAVFDIRNVRHPLQNMSSTLEIAAGGKETSIGPGGANTGAIRRDAISSGESGGEEDVVAEERMNACTRSLPLGLILVIVQDAA
ncbi:hypothetical protein BDZ89DRAFT_1037173 [Hymenopellis radicata]|nr:hypothetical protein BDZ89DRAFT_1037173 [Hymenopellis radicata]